MGAAASVDKPVCFTPRTNFLSKLISIISPSSPPLIAANTQWRIETPKATEIKSNEQELLQLLADPIGQKHLGAYAKGILTSETFFCWVEIAEFKDAPSQSYRTSLAKLIYKKYIKNGSPMALGSLPSEVTSHYDEIESQTSAANNSFFDLLMRYVVADMYQSTYVRFRSSIEYESYRKDVKATYNRVTVEDFEYLELLGSGGFGRVVHARKKSTGKHYAIKIQLKAGLLEEHRDQLSQITSERDILQACQNPFVLDMHYSFQTSAHAIIVTELVRGGDLGSNLMMAKSNCLSEDRMRLYAAEIGLALNHIHELGLIYRDLKPGNVLLGEDGHIVLADMGLAAGVNPTLLNQTGGRNHAVTNPKLVRRKTTVGTRGYMAPEIISGKLVKRENRRGYTFSVDYWSLGVTMYELLAGYQPFGSNSAQYLVQDLAQEDMFRLSPQAQYKMELQRLTQGVSYPPNFSKVAKDFLSRLLEANAEQRLGCSVEKGFSEFMEHPFFESIDWEKLVVKHITPSYKPTLPPLAEKKIYGSYQQMMTHFDAREKDFSRYDWGKVPLPEMQKYFDAWDYISLSTLRAELGIAKELEETNIPYKVLQLTGEEAKSRKL